jgi:hypothetical protein
MNKKITALALAAATLASCSWWDKNVQPDITAAIDCVKTEESAAAKGVDALQAGIEIADALETALATLVAGGDPIAALDAAAAPFIAKYGEPLVACVVHAFDPSTGSGSGSGSAVTATAPSILDQWIAKRNWKYTK